MELWLIILLIPTGLIILMLSVGIYAWHIDLSQCDDEYSIELLADSMHIMQEQADPEQQEFPGDQTMC